MVAIRLGSNIREEICSAEIFFNFSNSAPFHVNQKNHPKSFSCSRCQQIKFSYSLIHMDPCGSMRNPFECNIYLFISSVTLKALSISGIPHVEVNPESTLKCGVENVCSMRKREAILSEKINSNFKVNRYFNVFERWIVFSMVHRRKAAKLIQSL